MKIAILQTGSTPEKLNEEFKSYPGMILDLLKPISDKFSADIFICTNNKFPKNIKLFDGFIIPGSAFGVYDDEKWITNLFNIINEIIYQSIPLVGICFGHQAIAQAIGGKVIKSDKGWGVGIRKMNYQNNKEWINPPILHPKLIYSHQDQVIKLPQCAEILSGDEFCPISSFCIEDKVYTIQGHPEFGKKFALKLLHLRKEKIGHKKFIVARKTLLDNSHDGKMVGKWINNFLQRKFY